MTDQHDGVSDAPGKTGGGGESAGGAYSNGAGEGKEGGYMGHGGQSHQAYSGPGDKTDPSKGEAGEAAGEDNGVSEE